MEKLKAYLASGQIKKSEFARKVGITPSALSDLLSGRRTPGLATAGRIAAASRGKVPVSSWLDGNKGAA